jgi:hypothetical protein
MKFSMMQQLLLVVLIVACYTQAFSPSAKTSNKQCCSDSCFSQVMNAEDSSTVVEETLVDLPPLIQQIADERREFQVNLGKAMDTIRKDMPEILKSAPGKTGRHKIPLLCSSNFLNLIRFFEQTIASTTTILQ